MPAKKPSAREQALQYIRDYYHVPAYVGVCVIVPGKEPAKDRTGTIAGAEGSNLKVELPGKKHPQIYHPTWEMIYLPSGQAPISFRECDQPKAAV
jgi:hypothetical protein